MKLAIGRDRTRKKLPLRKSLRHGVSISVTAAFLTALPVVALVVFAVGLLSATAAVRDEERKLSGFLNAGLARDLWDIDINRVVSLGSLVVRDWNVVALKIADDRAILFNFASHHFAEGKAAPVDLPLTYNGVHVGDVSFRIDERPYRTAALRTSALFGLMGLALLGLTLVVLRRAILAELRAPLDEISFLVSAFGTVIDKPAIRDKLRYVEFDRLRELLVRMGETINRQITELESSIKERDILMQEINHRVKNNLQLLASIIDQQAEKAGKNQDELHKLLRRIQTLSLAYDQLWSSRGEGGVRMDEYLTEIARLTAESYFERSLLTEMDLEPLVFTLDCALPCGLIVYELTANAAEYAYDNSGGLLRVELKNEGGGDIVLKVEDKGKGCGRDFRSFIDGQLGFRFVDALSAQIGATVEQENSGGCRFTIRIPAAKAIAFGQERTGAA